MNEFIQYQNHMFNRIVEIQLGVSAVRKQYGKRKGAENFMGLADLRTKFKAQKSLILAIVNASSQAEYNQNLEAATKAILDSVDGQFHFGTIRKCLNLVVFMCATTGAFISTDTRRQELFHWLEVPVDNLVFNHLKKVVKTEMVDQDMKAKFETVFKGSFTISGLAPARHEKIQEFALKLTELDQDSYPYRYYVDFLAWRPETESAE